jgi:DNA/RNA-binding domain of Phe-tRNA-synthetase-like protein
MFEISPALTTAYPGAHAGVLAMKNVTNPPQCPSLDIQKEALENQIRERFSGQDRSAILALPVIQAYEAYYKPFKKTYHVQLQLESIAFKGKTLPNIAALVEAMFMAEVKNLLLTAGHDLDKVDLPVMMDVAQGDESYTLLRGQEQTLKTGDMFMADRKGVISSIIYGPDLRTPITNATRHAIFTVYAPPGIEISTIEQHLADIRQNVLVVAPEAQIELLQVY